jgi:hypothetical protein
VRFWPFKKKKVETKPVELRSPDGPPPPYLQAAFDEAMKRPLDDLVLRLIIASPHRHIITDVGIMTMSAHCETHEKFGLERAWSVSGPLLSGVFEKNLSVASRESLDMLRFGAFAFFDGEFTRGANKGKTHETAWNTLALLVETSPDKVIVSRRAVRLEYPVGIPDLSFPGGLFNPFR